MSPQYSVKHTKDFATERKVVHQKGNPGKILHFGRNKGNETRGYCKALLLNLNQCLCTKTPSTCTNPKAARFNP